MTMIRTNRIRPLSSGRNTTPPSPRTSSRGRDGCAPERCSDSALEPRRALLLLLRSSALGRRPTVGQQTLDLLIGVQIPASQLHLANSTIFVAYLSPTAPTARG